MSYRTTFPITRKMTYPVGKPNNGGAIVPAFNFDPLTAREIWTGDSITALEDCTGYAYWASALSGAPMYMPPGGDHGVSGSELNEGDVSINVADLLFPARLAVLLDALGPGDVLSFMAGTNSISNATVQDQIDGFTKIAALALDKGIAGVKAYTITPSGSNTGGTANTGRLAYNAFINALPTTGITYLGTHYSGGKFLPVDAAASWGDTFSGNTDSGNLHPNTLGAIKIGRAVRAALKAIGRAYCPLMYGTSIPVNNILTNAALVGSAGTFTGAGNTLVNNGVPTGVAVTMTGAAGLTVQIDTVTGYAPTDSIYSAVAAFTVVKMTVTGTASVQTDIAITMGNSISTEAAGSAYEGSFYAKWKGVGATADPSGLFAFGGGNGSVDKWASQNSSTATNFTEITLGDEGVFRGRSVPAIAAHGGPSLALTCRVRAGQTASFEIYFGQPLVFKAERVAYAIPKSVNTDQAGIGGGRATGPQVGTSNTTWTLTNGVTVTGRPGLSWRGGNLTFQYTWQRDRGGTVIDVAGPTTVTTTIGTTQHTPAVITGDKMRLGVDATNSFGTTRAYSVWSTAAP